MSNFSNINLIKRSEPVRRVDSSILKVYLDSVNWLFEHDLDFDWLICLSGQDYPVQQLSEVEDFLFRTEYDGFIRYWDIHSTESSWGERGYERYFAQYIHLPKLTVKLIKLSKVQYFTPIVLRERSSLVGLRTKSTPFSEEFICYGGRYWNTLSRECVKFVIDYLREHPGLLRYYNKTLTPEESIIQTVLVNSKLFNLCNDMKRYVEYPKGITNLSGFKGVAQILTVEDFPKITNSKFHFARKFDIKQDSKILDMIDAKLFNK